MKRNHRHVLAADVEWSRGSNPQVQAARFLLDEDDLDSPLVVLVEFEPGFQISAHTHASNYLEYIVSGELVVGGQRFGPGDVRIVRGGAGYGPISAGQDGCSAVLVYQRGSGSTTEILQRQPIGEARR